MDRILVALLFAVPALFTCLLLLGRAHAEARCLLGLLKLTRLRREREEDFQRRGFPAFGLARLRLLQTQLERLLERKKLLPLSAASPAASPSEAGGRDVPPRTASAARP